MTSRLDRLFPPSRLLWLDTARGLAVFGMVITHIFALSTADAQPTAAAFIAGKASALFAVLAGFSLVLTVDRRREDSRRTARALAVRGILIFAIGIVLGAASSRLAIILPVYGLMFLAAIPLLRLSVRTLALTAAAWCVVSPLISHALRGAFHLEPDLGSLGFDALAHPGRLLLAITLTGYYPMLQWMTYLLVGMALGRVQWTVQSARLALGAGLGLAALAWGASTLLFESAGRAALAQAPSAFPDPSLPERVRALGADGTVPTDSPWWLTVCAGHTGTPFDLALTIGTSAAIIACCVLAHAHRTAERALTPLHATGSMPLSAYAGHTIALEITKGMPQAQEFALHAAGLAVGAVLWRLFIDRRGPLEAAVSGAAEAARG